jgi:hypothetical protein
LTRQGNNDYNHSKQKPNVCHHVFQGWATLLTSRAILETS